MCGNNDGSKEMNDLIEYRPFITEKAYLIGEANGLSREIVYQRWARYMWEIERAITEPMEQNAPSEWLQWKEIATKNGIYNSLFHVRLKKGMSAEKAATMPVATRGKYNTTIRGRGKYLQTIKH